MKRYPEWFLGGPLDGQDKAETHPHKNDWSTIEVDDGTIWTYSRYVFRFGDVEVPIWRDQRLTSREIALCRLGEILLAPHEKREPEKCVCSDSGHSRTGRCPVKGSHDYEKCPRRHYSEETIIALTKKSIPQNETETES